MKNTSKILLIIVVSQFCCTSLWFSGNAIIADLINDFQLSDDVLGHFTSAVQFGFIIGTLVYAILTITDRFSPSKVFFFSAITASLCNLGNILASNTLASLLIFRFLTGFFLAGIYPVGMKIAADYFEKGLGKSLGFLVGALVLGTAFPHLLNDLTDKFPWQMVVLITSIISVFGGLLILVGVPNGPYRKSSKSYNFKVFLKVFENRKFKSAAFGYFGHMWELYAFWTFVPVMLVAYLNLHPNINFNIPLLSFVIIAFGSVACVIGGYTSQVLGAKNTASIALTLSCLCCLLSPLFFYINSGSIFIGFLIFWGMVVIADSPLFSTLVAQNAPAENKGTALTIVNCFGFAITIVSIQLINNLNQFLDPKYIFTLLAIGPFFGLIVLFRK